MNTEAPTWEFKLFFDGECPLCVREANFMRRLDAGRGKLALEDLTDPSFDASKYDADMNDLLDRIHGITPDGQLIEGLEVFRRAYNAVGKGWIFAWSGWPIVRPFADLGYRLFAKYRYAITFRKRPQCDSNRCYIKGRGGKKATA